MPQHTDPSRDPRPSLSVEIDPADRYRASSDGDEPPRPKREPKPKRQRQPKAPRSAGKKRKLAGRVAIWLTTLLIWVGIGIIGVIGYYALDLPDIDKVTATPRRPSVVFQSVEGETFAAFGDLYGEPLELRQISPFIAQAVMATEDRRFYHHFGIDPIGLLRALFVDIRAGRLVQGGSTITQQLAKNLFLTPERNAKRKVQELLMALWLEKRLTKDQILTLYLNRVYLGSGTFGVDAAAKRYFNVSARTVDVYEAALIAGLLKAPSTYSPLNDPEASHARTVDVLHNMVAAGYIDQQAADMAAISGAAQLVRRPEPAGRYFADWLLSQLNGISEAQGKDIIVRTTLDVGLQRSAEASLKTLIEGPGAKANVSQGAVVVLSPDGAVRALVGGTDYDESQFNRATQAARQPGSSFKPFVYLAAMEHGHRPEDVIEDAPIKLGKWEPGNYSGKYEGAMTLRHAFANSTNTVAVRLIQAVGPARVIEVAHRLGINSELGNDASLALGTSEVNPLELTTAYAAFANGGTAVAAYGIAEILDTSGHTLFHRQGGGYGQAIARGPLVSMQQMMSAVLEDGTGKAARLDRPAAGKTGTTQDYRDAWFLGYTADYVAGVWLGNDDQRHEMKKVTGGGLPAQLWKQIMMSAHRGLPARPLVLPAAPEAEDADNPIGTAAAVIGDTARGIGDAVDGLLNSLFGRH
jgi:penicillin-binding protein 1A